MRPLRRSLLAMRAKGQ